MRALTRLHPLHALTVWDAGWWPVRPRPRLDHHPPRGSSASGLWPGGTRGQLCFGRLVRPNPRQQQRHDGGHDGRGVGVHVVVVRSTGGPPAPASGGFHTFITSGDGRWGHTSVPTARAGSPAPRSSGRGRLPSAPSDRIEERPSNAGSCPRHDGHQLIGGEGASPPSAVRRAGPRSTRCHRGRQPAITGVEHFLLPRTGPCGGANRPAHRHGSSTSGWPRRRPRLRDVLVPAMSKWRSGQPGRAWRTHRQLLGLDAAQRYAGRGTSRWRIGQRRAAPRPCGVGFTTAGLTADNGVS